MDLDSSGTYQTMGTDGLMRMIPSGKAAFLLSFDANSNRLDDQLTTVRRKAVELQVPVVLTPEPASALRHCMAAARRHVPMLRCDHEYRRCCSSAVLPS